MTVPQERVLSGPIDGPVADESSLKNQDGGNNGKMLNIFLFILAALMLK